MMEETIKRARTDVFLFRALREGLELGMGEAEIFEKLVHCLLDIKDDLYQERLNAAMNATSPLIFNPPPHQVEGE